MKFNIILLSAFVGCALAGVISDVPEARDLAKDADVLTRDMAEADIGLVDRDIAEEAEFDAVARDIAEVAEEAEVDVVSREEAEAESIDIGSRDEADIDLVERDEAEAQKEAQPPPSRCPNRRQATPFIRLGRFPFSTTRIIGFFFSTRRFNTVALFFLFNRRTNDFFYTTSVGERNNAIRNLGYQNRGIAGFIFFNQRCGGAPLFRLFNPRRGQHFYTTSQSERANAKRFGWNDEGVTGFIFRF